VSLWRWMMLLLGPLGIVGGSYWLTYGGRDDGPDSETVTSQRQPAADSASPPDREALQAACRRRADVLHRRQPDGLNVFVHAPFVLAGDLSSSKLRRLYRDLIAPVTRALQTCYFDRSPSKPITILVFSGDGPYRKHTRNWDGRSRACYSGYYLRSKRRIVVNLATGHGTLAHELAHALAHVDAPNIPEWFDEGLASLHEECEFSPDGLRLEGRSNWRLQYLTGPLRSGRLPRIAEMMSRPEIRGPHEAVNYALARYFCLYLQQRRLLAHYYRKLKATIDSDPTGRQALKQLLHTESLETVQRDFEQWLWTQVRAAENNDK